ncbi:2OG-Fe(II) oxygenase [Actinomarinicola tropica]|uniref:Fe2OG dioxygenase domain-containing protein n=1 Tax=Actinomarinicola tropica TaxID=2789776 RepID=A0A5Q2RJB9_9ACTN|nr:2OG-Fe(II) oxygenase [Actinomarinicola tropica]QGG95604.1 hypothetical protein GH723_11135 [Actinomarinicola tropica]
MEQTTTDDTERTEGASVETAPAVIQWIDPDLCRAFVDAAGERTPSEQHDGRPVADLDGAAAEMVYAAVSHPAVRAAPLLGAPLHEANFIYGKVLEYPTDSGELGWHFDADVALTDGQLALLIRSGRMHQWQAEEMRGRILSVMIQCSDGDSYDGGDLQIKDDAGTVLTAPRDIGTVIAIDSHRLHRVTPVTRGTRISIVCFLGRSPRGADRPPASGSERRKTGSGERLVA